jgi:hypothetical protein
MWKLKGAASKERPTWSYGCGKAYYVVWNSLWAKEANKKLWIGSEKRSSDEDYWSKE